MKRKVTIFVVVSMIFLTIPVILTAQEVKKDLKKGEKEEFRKESEEQRKKTEEFYLQNNWSRASTGSTQTEAVARAMDEYRDYSELDGRYFSDANYTVIYGRGSQTTTALQFTKSLKEATFTKDVKFDIDSDARKVSISISGSCKIGEVRIKVLMPGGKSYSEVLLDEYGRVNWSKTFTIEEGDKSKTGEWVFKISSEEATGHFGISMRSS
ncbi:MAG: hypothetical protein K8R35_02845 [Bacteroidales bacterium]|nr:hypothetical protein [Bacteroidales bacterium]